MPSEPTFDYYAELELEPGSSIDDARSAYRRLALIRHPDRNPNDATATASFQRLDEAHEALSDPDRKMIYDMTHVRTRNTSPRGGFFSQPSDTSGNGGFFSQNCNTSGYSPFPFSFVSNYATGPNLGPFCNLRSNGTHNRGPTRSRPLYDFENQYGPLPRNFTRRRPDPEQAERSRRAAEEAARQEAEYLLRQGNARREEEARRAEQRKAAEREAAEQKESADEERAEQDARWVRFRATTALDKRNACLHSQYDGWSKTTHQRKPKCESCNVKRSMTTFNCPYCELMVCQKCRTDLAKQKRDMAEKK